MAIDVDGLKRSTNIVDIIGRYVELKRRGSEYYGECPFHDDHHDSLQVNEKKQVFKCFACPDDNTGGDSIAFLTKMGLSFVEACEVLKGQKIDVDAPEKLPSRKKAPVAPEWNPVPFDGSIDPDFVHYKMGKADAYWAYHNDDGAVLCYVCRFNQEDGSKQVLPYTFASNGKSSEWRWLGLTIPRPLYNLHLLKQNPDANVLVVEGEKTADAVQVHYDPKELVVTAWIGGANGIKNADWKPLEGRLLIYWPDHDTEQKCGSRHKLAGQVKPWHEQPGNHAMLAINDMMSDKCPEASWINVPDDYPHKWDAADTDWKDGELDSFMKENISTVPERPKEVKVVQMEVVKPDVVDEAPTPPPPKEVNGTTQLENEHFRLLGFEKDEKSRLVYYFFSFDAKSVIKLSPTAMTKSNLMMLAPINFWEDWFPGSKSQKVNIDAVQQYLISKSHRIGTFYEKYIRGRGAWMDDGKMVIHTGEELLVDGVTHQLKQFRSKYVYEIGERLGLGLDSPMSTQDSMRIIHKMEWLNWERGINAFLIAGWCVIAPFCGVLPWRPHIWVTGSAGSGKSWVMERVIKRLLGEAALVVQGKTTEPGVRGLLQSDARPVLFDESDVDGNADKERIQNIISTVRASSYSDGGVIGKGTMSGQSKSYVLRSCFAFASIGVHLNQQSDKSRFTTLGIVPSQDESKKAQFPEFELSWDAMTTDADIHSLQARTLKLMPVILKNIKTFSDAAAHVIGDRRTGDQVGGMLAGAYSLMSEKEISYDDAVSWCKDKNWDEEKGLELTKDEYRLFSLIMGNMTRTQTDHGFTELTIGELIMISSFKLNEFALSAETAERRLRREGVMVKDDRVYIANSAPGIKQIIRNTAWTSSHGKMLARLPDAEKIDPRTFYPGLNSRSVSLPLSMVTEGYEFNGFGKNDAQSDNDDLPF